MYKKIDIYTRSRPSEPWTYVCSTNWSRTCGEALRAWLRRSGWVGHAKARFAG